jgi:hypothetical protein
MQLQSTLLAAFAASVSGHIHMIKPAPITAAENPNSGGSTDYDINSPLANMGAFPCKGALKHLGTPVGASVATWAAGSQQSVTIGKGAAHNGGSCQLSLSYDQGATFRVIKDIIGNCPTQDGVYDFTVPAEAPAGDEVVFSWSWINHTGNREFYQNCAVVSITGGGAATQQSSAFDSLPDIFVANLGNGCNVAEGIDVAYPNPAPEVEDNSSSKGAPSGNCGASGGGSGGGAAPPSPPSSTPAPSSYPTANPTIPGGGFITQTEGPSSAAPTSAAPTTFSTATYAPSGAPIGAPSGASSSASPPVATGNPGASFSGSCTDEGAWNCIGSTSYQRCASGAWTPVMPLAAGTSCQPGMSSTLSLARRRDSALLRRRGMVAQEW